MIEFSLGLLVGYLIHWIITSTGNRKLIKELNDTVNKIENGGKLWKEE